MESLAAAVSGVSPTAGWRPRASRTNVRVQPARFGVD